jgi:YVTN family beta-propeller protein
MRDLAPGTVVAGYRIESLVGRGGMGVVYRAMQLDLERVVALKVIAPELLDDKDVRARFLTEARAAASVDHPNVIPVHAAGEDDGIAYIAMRFVAGDDLRALVRYGGPFDPAGAASIVEQAAAALDAIHRAGFVHRDVKPANLLIDRDNHVYLTDFGLAKAVITHSAGTRTGQWVGTLDYVAPEQIRGGRIDARADVYALGGVLHFALTGHVPFEREGDEAKLWAQLSAPPPVPSAIRAGLPAQFDVAVARAMAKEPDERYPSAGDLGRAARAAALGRAPSEPERMVARGAAAPGAAPTEPGLAAEASTRTAARFPMKRPRRRRGPLLVAAGVLLAVAVTGTALVMREDPPGAATVDRSMPTPTATVQALPRVEYTIENVGDRPDGIALAGGDLWVISSRQANLTRVVAATGKERRRHPRVGPGPVAIAAHDDGVWVALDDGVNNAVVRLDAETGRERGRIQLPASPRWLAVDDTGVWVGTDSAVGQPGMVLHYDHSGAPRQRITVGEGVDGLVAAPDTIWVVKRDTNTLARMKPDATQFTDWAALPGRAANLSYADPALWVVLEDQDTIVRVEAETGGVIQKNAGSDPAQSLHAGGRVYVTSRNTNAVLVLDPETLEPTQDAIGVGLNPYALVADARSIWVTGLGDNTLTQIRYR